MKNLPNVARYGLALLMTTAPAANLWAHDNHGIPHSHGWELYAIAALAVVVVAVVVRVVSNIVNKTSRIQIEAEKS